jgi:hypothetical protein
VASASRGVDPRRGETVDRDGDAPKDQKGGVEMKSYTQAEMEAAYAEIDEALGIKPEPKEVRLSEYQLKVALGLEVSRQQYARMVYEANRGLGTIEVGSVIEVPGGKPVKE